MTTIAMTMAKAKAKERQLDWLLDEVLGGGRAAAAPRRTARAMPWLAAAIALFAIGAALGVAWLRALDDKNDDAHAPVQQPAPAIPWRECHGAGALDAVPADVTALKCFDFDDNACVRLAKFTKLEHLDLSGMDVDDKGYAVSLPITDAGVRALAPLVALRSLSLSGCAHMKGAGLQVLEAMPRLEQLDLTYSGVETLAVERLARLPSLRTLSLASCMNFHGRAIAAIASIPGLRVLDLRGCVTMSAKDALPLAKLKELRSLDLRDCQGRFRGQTEGGFADVAGGQATFVDTDEDGIPDKRVAPPPPPVQDGIGITDEVVAALAALPLESLKLGGSESLTDAIGESLAKMTALRELDLTNLPKTKGALLARVPSGLERLRLDDNRHLTAAALAHLPTLPKLRELGLGGLVLLDDATLRVLLAGKQLTVLWLGGYHYEDMGTGRGTQLVQDPALTTGVAAILVEQTALEVLHLDHNATWIDGKGLARLAALPKLRELDLTMARHLDATGLAQLASLPSLRVLNLSWCTLGTGTALASLVPLPLRELNLYATKCDPATVRELAAKHWHGCVVTLAGGQRFRAP
jgi:hypothetical protein